MKVVAATVLVLVVALMGFPALFASGDSTRVGCGVSGDVGAVLATIRHLESRGDYAARARGSTASGAYQFVDGTWGNFDGYSQAWQAPPTVQDARAATHVQTILDANGGDVNAVPVAWYIGHVPAPDSAEWDQVPYRDAGNFLTPRQYQQRWLTEYQRHLAGATDDADAADDAGVTDDAGVAVSPVISCAGPSLTASDDGFAYPGPPDVFADAPVGEPHHDYPAWDWGLPAGTPVYAVVGGEVVTVQDWPYNWWDHGCGRNPDGCKTCGIGVTIRDSAGNRWAYCHGSAIHVKQDDVIAAGTQVVTSGNTGRSSGPHLHLQITTPDDQLRCPQPLLSALQTAGRGVDPASLPTSGCSFAGG